MKEVVKWLKITRPQTLFAGFSPVAIGIIVASKTIEINWTIAIATFIGAMTIQILSNFVM